ncbi:MAG: hypothetical protein M0Z55_04635 [Peptococcaceae bacterium]|nr:hypothetical protein [Peptococcaceae bacterium]
MLIIKSSPNHAGVILSGDCRDFDALYNALSEVVGEEGEFRRHDAARLRVLGICYDLRHALMGDRELEFVDNGMNMDMMKRLGVISQDKNVYLSISVLWPEMIFALVALNDFCLLRARSLTKARWEMMETREVAWDFTIARVRLFQAEIVGCLKQILTEQTYKRMLKVMFDKYTVLEEYITQYLDLQNIKFVGMDKEKRLKSLSTMAKRLVEMGDEYQALQHDVQEAAKEHNTDVNNIRLKLEFPAEFEW